MGPAAEGSVEDPRLALRRADRRELLAYLVGRAALAPSPRNTQPWRFRCREPAVVDLDWVAERRLEQADPEGRLMFVALGAALENFLIAARDLGLDWELEWFPEGEDRPPAARVRLGGVGPLPEPDARVDLQDRRRTAHGRLSGPIEPAVRRMVDAMGLGEASLAWAEGACQQALAEHGEGAASRHWRRPAYRREQLAWLRKDREELAARGDGLALTGWRWFPAGLAGAVRWTARHLPALGDPGARTGRRIRQAPALLAVVTPGGDDRRRWLAAGRAYQRLGLGLAHAGHALGPEGVLTADPGDRRETARILGSGQPQVVARVGRARSRPERFRQRARSAPIGAAAVGVSP